MYIIGRRDTKTKNAVLLFLLIARCPKKEGIGFAVVELTLQHYGF
jgi:hypothetical protein